MYEARPRLLMRHDPKDRHPELCFPYTQGSDIASGEVEAAHIKSGMALVFGNYVHMWIRPRAILRGDFGT